MRSCVRVQSHVPVRTRRARVCGRARAQRKRTGPSTQFAYICCINLCMTDSACAMRDLLLPLVHVQRAARSKCSCGTGATRARPDVPHRIAHSCTCELIRGAVWRLGAHRPARMHFLHGVNSHDLPKLIYIFFFFCSSAKHYALPRPAMLGTSPTPAIAPLCHGRYWSKPHATTARV